MFLTKNIQKVIGSTAVIATLFSGCATMELQTQVKTSKSIFLNPVRKEKRIAFISIRNTSGQMLNNLQPLIQQSLIGKGYKVTDDPEIAQYVVMANVLFANDKKENNMAGAAAVGAVGAGAVSGYNGDGAGGVALAAAGGALIAGIIGKLTEDTIYQMVVDVNIREKTDQKVTFSKKAAMGEAKISDGKAAGLLNTFGGDVRNNNGGGKMDGNTITGSEQEYQTNYIESTTRIFAEATKRDLQLTEALPVLENKIASQIAGIF